jgi:hypothetical protein
VMEHDEDRADDLQQVQRIVTVFGLHTFISLHSIQSQLFLCNESLLLTFF